MYVKVNGRKSRTVGLVTLPACSVLCRIAFFPSFLYVIMQKLLILPLCVLGLNWCSITFAWHPVHDMWFNFKMCILKPVILWRYQKFCTCNFFFLKVTNFLGSIYKTVSFQIKILKKCACHVYWDHTTLKYQPIKAVRF